MPERVGYCYGCGTDKPMPDDFNLCAKCREHHHKDEALLDGRTLAVCSDSVARRLSTCVINLPGVTNACCGHGDPGASYIQFSNGVTIRGFDQIDGQWSRRVLDVEPE